MRNLVAVVLACLSLGCASLGGQPLQLVCKACAIIQESGLCAPTAVAAASCPEGKKAWVANFGEVLKKGAEPKVECR